MASEEIVLYHYVHSPYARRIVWYLALRGIPYNECLQPPMLPRPDVARLGVSYRRIPIMSIGRDVYLDTRLQLQKLEDLRPDLPRLGASDPDQQAIERLLSSHVTDGGVFANASTLLPTNLPLMRDPKFQKDRSDFRGSAFSKEALDKARPGAETEIASMFAFLETTLLADGRDWILKTEKPGLADIEAVWPLIWVAGLPGALPKEQFSPSTYPKVFAWMKRFKVAVEAAAKSAPQPKSLSGEEAGNLIEGSAFHDGEGAIEPKDSEVLAQGFKKADIVQIFPTDTGRAHKDVGKLVSLNSQEIVIELASAKSSIRLHAPRHGFRVQKKADSGSAAKL